MWKSKVPFLALRANLTGRINIQVVDPVRIAVIHSLNSSAFTTPIPSSLNASNAAVISPAGSVPEYFSPLRPEGQKHGKVDAAGGFSEHGVNIGVCRDLA